MSFILQWTLCTSFFPKKSSEKSGQRSLTHFNDPSLCSSKPIPCVREALLISSVQTFPVSKSPINFFLLPSCPLWLLLIYQSTLPPFFFTSPFRLFRNTFFLCCSIGENFAFTHLTFVSESRLSVFYFLCVLAPFCILFWVHASFFLKAVFMHRCITYPFIVHKTSKIQGFSEGFCQFCRFNSL